MADELKAPAWLGTSRDGTLFDQWSRYAGVEPNTPESKLAYQAWSASREYFYDYLTERPRAAKDKLKAYFDPKGDNFLGTGMSMQEFMASQRIEQIQCAYVTAERPERKHRLKYILLLSHELEEIKKTTIQATGLAEMSIEHIILGEWKTASDFIQWLAFEDEDRSGMAKIFAKFVKLLREAYETRPDAVAEEVKH